MAVGVALFAIAVIAYVNITSGDMTAFESGREPPMTSRTFPVILSSGLALLSALYTLMATRRWMQWRNADAAPPAAVTGNELGAGKRALLAIGTIGLLFAYAYLLQKVSFFGLTWAFLLFGFYLFGQRRHGLNLLVSGVSAAFFYGLFIFVLQLPLEP